MRTISLHLLTAATLLATGVHHETSTSVSNLRDKGIVHSGFLVGTANSDVSLVEVSVDGGATFQAATGTANWKFKLPSGAATWKDNSAHTIAVRATDGAGNITISPTLNVRKGANQDVDGDGFADVLVGAPAFDSNRGRIYLFYSSKDGSGIPSTPDANNLDDPTVKVIGGAVGEGEQMFGASTAMADVNGDGFADLVVGAPASIGGAGHLYVFYAIEVAPGSALVVQGNATGTSTQISGDAGRLLRLGTSVAAGDIDGDGLADVVAGAPGRVYVFNFAALSAPTVFGATATIVASDANAAFGTAVAIGDINGDGFSDLIAGATLASGASGQVYVFNAATDGSGVHASSDADASTHITGEPTSQLGGSLAIGDLNGDGFLDIVAGGAAFADAGNPIARGRVYVFYSTGSNGVASNPVLDPNNRTDGQHIIGGEFGAGAQEFGASLAVGDVSGDGVVDLIVGAPEALSGAGRVYIFHSTPGSGLAQGNAINARSTGTQLDGVAEVVGGFGTAVSAGDVNGDGIADVFAGANGSAYLFHAVAGRGVPGAANGILRILEATSILVGEPGSLFGASIAR